MQLYGIHALEEERRGKGNSIVVDGLLLGATVGTWLTASSTCGHHAITRRVSLTADPRRYQPSVAGCCLHNNGAKPVLVLSKKSLEEPQAAHYFTTTNPHALQPLAYIF